LDEKANGLDSVAGLIKVCVVSLWAQSKALFSRATGTQQALTMLGWDHLVKHTVDKKCGARELWNAAHAVPTIGHHVG
jgi:hypothetical protein